MVNLDLSPKAHKVTKPASNAGEKEAHLLLSPGIFVMNHVHYRAACWKASGFAFLLLFLFFFLATLLVWLTPGRFGGVEGLETTGCRPWSRRRYLMEKCSEGSARSWQNC